MADKDTIPDFVGDHRRADAALAEALANAQAEFPAIKRNREVQVRAKSGANYRFSYTTLDELISCTRGALQKNGLAVTQLLESMEDRDYLITELLHRFGGVKRSRVRLPKSDDPQEFGSGMTYVRRYSYAAILNLSPDEDDDGNAAAGNEASFKDRAPGRVSSHGAERAEAAGEITAPAPPAPTPTAAKPSVYDLQELGEALGKLGVWPTEEKDHAKKQRAAYAWTSKILGRDVKGWAELTKGDVTKLHAAIKAGEK